MKFQNVDGNVNLGHLFTKLVPKETFDVLTAMMICRFAKGRAESC